MVSALFTQGFTDAGSVRATSPKRPKKNPKPPSHHRNAWKGRIGREGGREGGRTVESQE